LGGKAVGIFYLGLTDLSGQKGGAVSFASKKRIFLRFLGGGGRTRSYHLKTKEGGEEKLFGRGKYQTTFLNEKKEIQSKEGA